MDNPISDDDSISDDSISDNSISDDSISYNSISDSSVSDDSISDDSISDSSISDNSICYNSISSSQLRVTGTEFNYYFICHRKLWLFSHDIQMEHTSDNVFIGKLIDEHTYPRQKKEIMIDGMIKIDFMDDETVHEVKKSDRLEEAHIGQVLYYIYFLRQKGVDIRKGVINYPKLRKTTEVELTEEKEKDIREILRMHYEIT